MTFIYMQALYVASEQEMPDQSIDMELIRHLGDKLFAQSPVLDAFEQRLLARFVASSGRTDWSVNDIAVVERTETGVGFVSDLRTKWGAAPGVPTAAPWTLLLTHPRLPHDGIATLWLETAGFPTSLEVVSFDAVDWPRGDQDRIVVAESACPKLSPEARE